VTDANYNVAIGAGAMQNQTSGNVNVAIGYHALLKLVGGRQNIAIGGNAGYLLEANESNNILIGNLGSAGDQGTLRLGGTNINTAFIAGISGATTAGGAPVLVNGGGKLGTTTSSARYKERIRSLESRDDLGDRLRSLRPVSFRYRPEVAGTEDPPTEYGLIAEEVAAVFPELVVDDEQGRPSVVRTHQLVPLLLAELQRQRRELVALEERLEGLAAGRDRLAVRAKKERR